MLTVWVIPIIATFLATCAGLWLCGEVGLWWISRPRRVRR